MAANFLFLRNFALKKDTFHQYKTLITKILQTFNSFWLYLCQFLEFFMKILLIKFKLVEIKGFVLDSVNPKGRGF